MQQNTPSLRINNRKAIADERGVHGAAPTMKQGMKHVIVRYEPGMFYGWPANNGVWSWGNEIVVGFTEAYYSENERGHSLDRERPRRSVIGRSPDGGETWSLERPEGYPEGFTFGADAEEDDAGGASSPNSCIDFSDPNLAIRCRNKLILVSYDRGRTWDASNRFPSFGFSRELTSRTDYIPLGKRECLFFISVTDPGVRAGIADRAFSVITKDGGVSFEFLGYMLPETPEIRSVMPSTVRVSESRLVSILRRRYDIPGADGSSISECWIDAAVSEDLGKSWRFASKVADTHSREHRHNGNPPSLVRLPDGRLCAVYGYRAPVMGMRARVSEDDGISWGPELAIRSDARTWDFGYPRSVVRPDGRIVSIYYYTTEEHREQHIAATIWHPDEAAGVE